MGNCRSQQVVQESGQLAFCRSRKKSFNPFFEPNVQDIQQEEILSHYNFHSNYDDKFLGRCSILEHKETRNFYLSKEIQISSSQEYEEKLDELLEIQQKVNSENIIQIKHIIEKESDGFFQQTKKIIVVVDYPLTNLQREMNSRILNKFQFSREEIINILISSIKGYALIESHRHQASSLFKNDKIRLKNIFFGIKNRESLIKVAESSLLNQKSNLQCIIQNAYDWAQNRDIYLAPQEFQAFIKKDKSKTFERAGVFSFGMLILDLCLMTSSREAYHYDEKAMDFNQIRNRILIAGKKFGVIIEKFLMDMLEIDDKKRLNFRQLQSKIPSLLISKNAEQGSKMNLSIAKTNSLYLKNSHRSIRQNKSRSRQSVRSRSNSRSSVNRGNISQNYSSISIASRYNSKIGMRMRGQKQLSDELERVHQIYDKVEGREYIGQKKGNLKHGEGRYQFQKGGAYYDGQWRNNKMEGKGETFFREGQLEYSGQWKADQYHGWGTLYSNPDFYIKWVSYEGEFKNGLKQGRGQMKFKNGLVYDGQFRGDKIHGKGKLIKDGKVIKDSFWQLVSPEKFSENTDI